MPIVTATLIEGYDAETRARLSRALTDAVRSVIDAPVEAVTVVLNEVPADNYMRGGQRRVPGPPRPPASQTVRDFLAAMERRDLAAAGALLADGFTMTFPGGVVFGRLEELVAWARDRYAAIAKTYERFEEFPVDGGAAVYCFGTLHGQWPDGRPFDGIRFIDRFTVADGKLADQRVWNDLAEAAGR